MLVYLLHSIAFLFLPRRNPGLAAAVALRLDPRLQRAAAGIAVLALSVLIVNSVWPGVARMFTPGAVTGIGLEEGDDAGARSLNSIKLLASWSLLGAVLFVSARKLGGRDD